MMMAAIATTGYVGTEENAEAAPRRPPDSAHIYLTSPFAQRRPAAHQPRLGICHKVEKLRSLMAAGITTVASFAFGGTELVSLAAAEAKTHERPFPKATK
jgi:amino acid permease